MPMAKMKLSKNVRPATLYPRKKKMIPRADAITVTTFVTLAISF